jgi:F-type H+-transporting ATPase subunit delta
MQNDVVLARVYARALDECLSSEKEINRALMEIEAFLDFWDGCSDFREALLSPFVSLEKTLGILDGLLKKLKPAKKLGNFLRLLLKNQRLGLLGKINREYIAITDQRLNRGSATVFTSQELDEKEQQDLKKRLEVLLKKSLTIHFEVRTELLGGFMVKSGGVILDYSVQGQMERMQSLVQKMRVW